MVNQVYATIETKSNSFTEILLLKQSGELQQRNSQSYILDETISSNLQLTY
jgi:hypothetical protein